MYEWNVKTLLNTTKRQNLRIISIKGGKLFHAKDIASIFNENSPNLGIPFQAHQKNQRLFSLNHIGEGLIWCISKSERSWLPTQSNAPNKPSQRRQKGKVSWEKQERTFQPLYHPFRGYCEECLQLKTRKNSKGGKINDAKTQRKEDWLGNLLMQQNDREQHTFQQ